MEEATEGMEVPGSARAASALAHSPAAPAVAAAPIPWARWAPALVLLGAWGILWNKLRIDWATNDQYSYGWFVPPLAFFLLALRWPDRPAARGGSHGRLLALAAAAALAVFLPLRLVEEPNADWRLLVWLHAGLLAGLTLAAAAWAGGRGWVRHFAFPILFLLLAVRWPSGPEQAIVQSLMGVVAAIATEVMNLLGIGAIQQGNLIRVHGQLVGVDEACSGIRSLQTMLMAGLFLGEMSRLSVARRCALVAGGMAVALAANVFRSGLLVWIAARHGTDELERFHDRAGMSVLVCIFVGLIVINSRLERGQRRTRAARVPAAGAGRASAKIPAAPAAPAPSRPPLIDRGGERFGRIPAAWIIAAAAWLVAAELATAGWYGAHERTLVKLPGWTVALPRDAPGYKDVRIDDASRNMLRFDEGMAGRWPLAQPAQAQCTVFFFRWEPGRTSALLAAMHQPHVCLAATGMEQTADFGIELFPTPAGVALPVRRYEFVQHGHKLYVFWVVWQNRSDAAPPADAGGSRWDRLEPVWRGERNLGQQTLELVLNGAGSAEEARALFEGFLRGGLVRRTR